LLPHSLQKAPEAFPAPQRGHFLDELGRWLSAYLSGAIRDQLLLSGAATPP